MYTVIETGNCELVSVKTAKTLEDAVYLANELQRRRLAKMGLTPEAIDPISISYATKENMCACLSIRYIDWNAHIIKTALDERTMTCERYEIKKPMNLTYTITNDKDKPCRLSMSLDVQQHDDYITRRLYIPSNAKGMRDPEFDMKDILGKPYNHTALKIIRHVLSHILDKLKKMEMDDAALDCVPYIAEMPIGVSHAISLPTRDKSHIRGFKYDADKISLDIHLTIRPCDEMAETEPFEMPLRLICQIKGDEPKIYNVGPKHIVHSIITGFMFTTMSMLDKIDSMINKLK